MGYDGTLQFDTRIDESGFDKGLGSMKGKATGAGDVMKGILGSNLLQAGLEKMVEVGRQGIQLASDLEEVQNVVDVTFGEGAAEIESFAETASGAFGLTELQAKQFTGTVGAMVKSMGLTEKEALDMSKGLVGLTGDMASFYNLDHETAFEKIRSGIAGETEPLKALGINMSVANLEAYALSKGITRAYEKMSEAEKVQLRYGYIMQQTADAQGDFVRTQDSYANQVRVLQNNLDTLAGNVSAMLIPALTNAVGWLNDLFDGPNSNETQAAINGAIEQLSGIEDEIKAFKNDYATTVLSIDINYKRADKLLEDFAALQSLPELTEDQAQQLKDISAALVDLYPQLKDYVGDDGILKKEAGAVRELVTNMRDLAKENAYITLVEGLKTTYTQGLVNYELLGAQYEKAIQEAENLQARVDALDKIDTVRTATQARYANGLMQPEYYQEMIDAINQYVEAFGGLENIDSDRINRLGIELSALFDGASLKSLEELTAADRMGDLLNLLGVISDADLNEEAIRSQYANAQTALLTAQDGLRAEAESLLLAAEELQTAEALYEEKFGGGNNPAVDYVTEAREAIQEQSEMVKASLEGGISDGASEGTQSALNTLGSSETIAGYADAGAKAGEEYGKAFTREAAKHAKLPPLVANYRSTLNSLLGHGHATGLDYVPYDNYLARLHVGEAVLPASEAREWRAGQQGFDYGALAAAIQGSNSRTGDFPLAFYIDGKELARAQADNNRIAMSEASRRIALGVGK